MINPIQKNRIEKVGLQGLEPKSAVLPLHHRPSLNCGAKVQLFFKPASVCLKKIKKFFSLYFIR